MTPRMVVVARPPGSGKSTLYPVSSFGVASFNADDRAALLNGGSYLGISNEIRRVVNREFEAFIHDQIARRESFAIETTLRSEVTFDQVTLAKAAGFAVEMRYIALRDFAMHIERVQARADAGGHSASERTLRRIYDASLRKLPPKRATSALSFGWERKNLESSCHRDRHDGRDINVELRLAPGAGSGQGRRGEVKRRLNRQRNHNEQFYLFDFAAHTKWRNTHHTDEPG